MLGFTVSLLAWTSSAWAGWGIEQVATRNGRKVQPRILLDANRMKTVLLGTDGTPVMTFVLDLNTDSVTHVDHAGGQYLTGTVQEYLPEDCYSDTQ